MTTIDLTTPEAQLNYRIKSMEDFIERKKSKGDLDSITAKMETNLNKIKSDLDNPDLNTQNHTDKLKSLVRQVKAERNDAKSNAADKPRTQPQVQVKSTILDKISDAIANAALAIARAFAKLVDFIFGTKLSESPALNRTFKSGTAISQTKQQEAKEEIKISEAKSNDNDKGQEEETKQQEEQYPNGKLSIKDVLRGKYSDSDIQKQQDELAAKGHRVFKVAGHSQTQSQTVSR